MTAKERRDPLPVISKHQSNRIPRLLEHEALNLLKLDKGGSDVDGACHLLGLVGFARPTNSLASSGFNPIVVSVRTIGTEEMFEMGDDRVVVDNLFAVSAVKDLKNWLDKPAWVMEGVIRDRKR